MKAAKLLLSAAASAGLAATAAGQIGPAQFPAQAGPLSPLAPPIDTAPPFPNATGIAPQPAAPGGPTLWSFLGVSQAQREYRRRQQCRTPFGQMMNAIQTPLSNVTGGLIRPFCPITPSLAELQDPGVIGAAAKVKQDRAGAAQRIEAIKLLAGVDCNYWPEAEAALIGALRTDRNECVRYEAALALSRGCCCTCKVIVALSHTVCCSDKDGGFMEKSARVRTAAAVALERCLTTNCACMSPELPANGGGAPDTGDGNKQKRSPELPPNADGTQSTMYVPPATAKPAPRAMKDSAEPMSFRDYYTAVPRVPREQVIANAHRALEIGRRIGFGVTEDVIPADYSAAGFATPDDAKTISHKPNSLWGRLTRPSAEQQAVEFSTPASTPAPVMVATVVKTTVVPTETAAKPPSTPKAVASVAGGTYAGTPAPTLPLVSKPLPTAGTAAVAKVTPKKDPVPTPAPTPLPTFKATTAAAPAPVQLLPLPGKIQPVSAPVAPVTKPGTGAIGDPVGIPVVPVVPATQPLPPVVPLTPAPANAAPSDPIPLNVPRSTPPAGPQSWYR